MTASPAAPSSDHGWAADQLSALLDSELDVATAATVEAHLRECEECQREFAELRATKALLVSLPQVRAPRPYVLPVEAPPESPFNRWQRLFAGTWQLAGAAAMVLALVWTVQLASVIRPGMAPEAALVVPEVQQEAEIAVAAPAEAPVAAMAEPATQSLPKAPPAPAAAGAAAVEQVVEGEKQVARAVTAPVQAPVAEPGARKVQGAPPQPSLAAAAPASDRQALAEPVADSAAPPVPEAAAVRPAAPESQAPNRPSWPNPLWLIAAVASAALAVAAYVVDRRTRR